jgi:D-3-phosphoglycerate dehydrogenase / 2-oxoglutarate reductase
LHVVIPDDYQDAIPSLSCFSKLEDHDVTIFGDTVKSVTQLSERFAEADALVLIRERTAITAELIEALPRLKLISQTGRGASHIDVDACTRRGIAICVGTGSPYAPAELTWALVLAASRRIAQEASSLRAGAWQTGLGRTLRGRTLGIWGYGKIGSLVAGFGRAFGMNVVAWGREGSLARAIANGIVTAASREELLGRSDVLSLHLRLEPATRGIMTADDLALMKEDSLIVNTSRAELIESGALVEALRRGRPGFAAVDVYEEEPIPGASHPLLQLDNTLCTPHLGYVEKDSYELYFGQAFDAVNAFAGGHPINVINPAALERR